MGYVLHTGGGLCVQGEAWRSEWHPRRTLVSLQAACTNLQLTQSHCPFHQNKRECPRAMCRRARGRSQMGDVAHPWSVCSGGGVAALDAAGCMHIRLGASGSVLDTEYFSRCADMGFKYFGAVNGDCRDLGPLGHS